MLDFEKGYTCTGISGGHLGILTIGRHKKNLGTGKADGEGSIPGLLVRARQFVLGDGT